MSLPVCQQRVLDRMEGALRASEPQGAVRKTVSATARLACGTAGQAARYTMLPGYQRAVPPAARVDATSAGPPGVC